LDLTDLGCEICGQILDASQRVAIPVESRGLQAEKGLIFAQVSCEGAEAKDVAIVASDGEYWSSYPICLERHDGALLLSERLGRAEEIQNLVLSLSQLNTQLGRKRADRGVTPQPVTIGADLDIAIPEHYKEFQSFQTSTSSRAPVV
jgi:hypothetical protein